MKGDVEMKNKKLKKKNRQFYNGRSNAIWHASS